MRDSNMHWEVAVLRAALAEIVEAADALVRGDAPQWYDDGTEFDQWAADVASHALKTTEGR